MQRAVHDGHSRSRTGLSILAARKSPSPNPRRSAYGRRRLRPGQVPCLDSPPPATYSPDAGTARGRAFSYEELVQRDKVSLNIFWLRDESLEDTENLPPPDVIADEIIENLEAALAPFVGIGESLAVEAGED